MGYIDIPVETEPVDLADEAFGYLEAQIPGWLPSPANLEAWLVEALAQIASELRELLALVPQEIFTYFGETILGLAPYAAVQAQGTTTWTAISGATYHVDAGTLVAITPPASIDSYAFEVVTAFDIVGGTNAAVVVRALEAGVAASGLSGTVQMLDSLDFVASVTLNAATSGGVDAEAVDHYLDRLSDTFTLLSPRPILPQDFALLAMSNPSVARATAIDLYNAQTATAGVPRCVTVVAVDASGNPVTAQVKADVDAMLQAEREVNFLVFVADPAYTSIDITFAVTAYPGYDLVATRALVISNLQQWLSPALWGVPPYGDTGTASWINTPTVRWLEVAEQINRTDGVNYISTLTIAKTGQALGTADVLMTGVAPLPKPGTIDGTVVKTP